MSKRELHLKALLPRLRVSQRELARAAGISPSTMNEIIARNAWPKLARRGDITAPVEALLRERGASDEDMATVWRPVAPKKTAPRKAAAKDTEDEIMLMRRQALFPNTKRHFNLMADPFNSDVRSHDDVYLSGDVRYVREAMAHTARHGGFMAVVGESGSGKSTLRRDLISRLDAEDAQVRIIEPYVLALEDNDRVGKTLSSVHIAEAILKAVAPLEKCYSSPEARFQQLHKALKDSHRAGFRHCLVIEEAHALPIPTIKHLKRFWELEHGFAKLLSIILIGQPELHHKLSQSNHAVREVVQRCEVVELRALNGNLAEYLAFKLGRAGADITKIITEDGIETIKSKLTGQQRGRDAVSLCYPLAVGNLLIAAMNQAAEIGAPLVTADVIRAV